MSDYIIINDYNVPEHVAKETGLYNLSGKKIIRNPEPVGFRTPEDYHKYGVRHGA